MKYTKPPISIEDQIALLKQRGMHFADDEHARHTLANINYYRLRAYCAYSRPNWTPIPRQSGQAFHGKVDSKIVT